MHLKTLILFFLCLLSIQTTHALTDRHLIIIKIGTTEPELMQGNKPELTTLQNTQSQLSIKDREQVKQMAERLLTHGFDNRSISAVYASTATSALETCQILSDIGVISSNKIRMDHRLGYAELEDPAELFTLYDNVEKNQLSGHIVFVTHERTSTKLIEGLTQHFVKLENAQPYILPLVQRIGTQ